AAGRLLDRSHFTEDPVSRRLEVLIVVVLAGGIQARHPPAAKRAFAFEEVMIPVRDGVRLQTVILTPTDLPGPLPILFRRTPYGVPSGAPPTRSTEDMARAVYILDIP